MQFICAVTKTVIARVIYQELFQFSMSHLTLSRFCHYYNFTKKNWRCKIVKCKDLVEKKTGELTLSEKDQI